jgi:hypothetical protein
MNVTGSDIGYTVRMCTTQENSCDGNKESKEGAPHLELLGLGGAL